MAGSEGAIMTMRSQHSASRVADHAKDRPHVSHLGTSALLFEAPGAFDLQNQRRIWALGHKAQGWPDVREAVPGMTNLLLTFKTPPRDIEALATALLEAWESGDEWTVQAKTFDIPVTYGGKDGPDLHHMAEHTGLSIDDVVRIHTGIPYTVFALGSHPGYGYLGIVDPRLAIPRRKVPRVSVPAGSVSIGGMQTGVSASPGPSGWHTIGRATMLFFDPTLPEPALLSPGDIVRFHVERIIP
jgi:KipI family sensor histidine kinase inhibitor